VKDEEVKQEKDDLQDEDKHNPHTPKEKCTRDDFVRWGKQGGRPSSSTKKTPTSLQKLIIQKASKEDLEEQAAMNKERYRNARDGAREKQRKELALKDRMVIAEFMEECIKKHNMKTHKGKHEFWEEVQGKYNVSRKRLQIIWQGREKDKELNDEKNMSSRRKDSLQKEFEHQEEEESPSMSSHCRTWMTGSMLSTAVGIRWIRQMCWMSG